VKVVVAGASDRGSVREENEDHFLIGGLIENRGGLAVDLDVEGTLIADYGLLVCVADGMGGYGGGAAASEAALRAMAAAFYAGKRTGADSSRVAADVVAASAQAQRAVQDVQRSDSELSSAGTTLAGLVLLAPRVLVVFHIGDSRVARYAGGMLRSLTVDHTPMGADVASGTLSEEQVVRSGTSNLLTRSLGSDTADLEIGMQTEWSPRDVFLIGSDGWWGLGRGSPAALIEDRTGSGILGRRLSDALLADALASDGDDNATVVTVGFMEEAGDG
jgi:PPM family protein phosphatase